MENQLSWRLEDKRVSSNKCRANFSNSKVDWIVEGRYGQDNSKRNLSLFNNLFQIMDPNMYIIIAIDLFASSSNSISGGARLLLPGADWAPVALVPEIKNK